MLIGIDASRAVTGQRTGTEAYAYYLTCGLIPLAQARGHQLRLYFNTEPPDNLFPSSVEQVVIPWPRLWTHVRLAVELHRRPPDVFFTPAHVIPLTYRGPSVATVHDVGFFVFPGAHTRRQVAYLRWSTGHNARRARYLLADSRATRTDLVRFYDAQPAKIVVVYPGIDPTLAPVQDPDVLQTTQRRYGIRPPYFLYIGTVQPRKNLNRLIDAYVASEVPHQLVIAGKAGWLAQTIVENAFTYQGQAANNIVMPGYVPDEDKAALISGAEALLYPSLYEGFGFPVLEAQACGTAVLCANTSSLPEIAGEGALLVDPLDTDNLTQSIRRLATDEDLRRTLAAQGQENVRRFDWNTAACQVLDVLEQAAAPNQVSPVD
ncbi:MAG: glycosyltransferase family 1 protein [Candidatus Promineifilaceae bacterium]|nr:glycosyltransferase family 1 protein [Candidatus Promineifilaceae bacterium]